MPRALKLTALAACVLAILFSVSFMYLKHDPTLSPIAPFVEDPYDAVGSFADEAVIFLSLLAFFRAFRPLGSEGASAYRQSVLAHAEMAVPLAVLLTLASNGIAMARHAALWSGAAAAPRLLGVQGAEAMAAFATAALVWKSARRIPSESYASNWSRAALVVLAGILLLALYPDQFRDRLPGALFTVEVGAVVLFASMWALGTAMLPGARFKVIAASPRAWWSGSRAQWAIVVVLAAMVGLVLVAAESTEGGGGPAPLPRLVLVASVYVGLEVVAVLIGFVALRRWLGLFESML